MRKVFISYARQNKPDVEQLVEHLRVLGCDTWHDSSLRGGQDWWDEILRGIADCDTFIAIISREALNSTACELEFEWAESLHKPVLPVALDPLTKALPRRFSTRQIVDYSDRAVRDRAALELAGGLATLSTAPPLPDPLPEPPPVPLSYLTDLVDLVANRKDLVHDQQRDILNRLEPALRSLDPDERRGGQEILAKLSSRGDLYVDVFETISRLKCLVEEPASVRSSGPNTTKPPCDGAEAVAEEGDAVRRLFRQLFLSEIGPRGRRYNPKIVASAAVVALLTAIAIVVVATHNRGSTQQLSHDRASGQQPYQAYVLAPNPGLTGANVYSAANTSSPLVGNLPVGKTVYIDCVLKGNSVEGPGVQGQPRQSTDLWDKIRPEGSNSDLGFMPDAWVNTNGIQARAPFC